MKKIFLILLVFVSVSTFAQNEPDDIIKKFFDFYETDSPEKAVEYIFSTSKWMSDSKDQIENVKTRLDRAIEQIGLYKGFNKISSKSIGDLHLTKTIILVRHERQPLRFNFTLYQAEDKWAIYNFSFDDSFDDEF